MFDFKRLKNSFLHQIYLAATSLPKDVEEALIKAENIENEGSVAQNVLKEILNNVVVSREEGVPICQDTGTHIHHIYYPYQIREKVIKDAVLAATREATEKSYLRPNAVDSLTNINSGDNVGIKNPQIYLHQWDNNYIHGKLMLKGGGSENVSAQYSLPDIKLDASRDLKGVRKVVLDAIVNAQGMGCAPGVLGIGVGGDRGTSFLTAKEQLFRSLFDKHPDQDIAKLEEKLLKEINSLDIGPMGFGGKTTVLGVKIGFAHRLPASYFVSIAYICWAFRKAEVFISKDDVKYSN